MMNKFLILIFCLFSLSIYAQTKKVDFVKSKTENKVDVLIGDTFFTSLLFPVALEKPVLYPLIAANGLTVTRGFPLSSRDGERIDHPHHVGYWLNYESVNGLDFWNNSYNIPAEKKVNYGWIRNVKVDQISAGKKAGKLSYSANWESQSKNILLKEQTTFLFSGTDSTRTIDRITTLTAQNEPVLFKDVKDGMVGLRVTKELEFPSDKTEEFTDSKGNVTRVSAASNGANGSYTSSAGKTGNDVWGTRGNWCLLWGTKDGKPISVAMIDHPKNPGYPTYWHARDYGLFAANPLGQQVFSNGKEKLNLSLKPGESVTFRYRLIITSDVKMNTDVLNQQALDFSTTK
ncbi:DUF6807 domain-containing protein [Pedobacter metabolipauper]|uniref:Methane monooxygenase PmoA-like n=1 Tax=Pedobacter metabolipauper TaxID=425513 RepID=A0A4R6SZY4_9SPHI|nr:PmoA family protein [Pedobacter metabolipauper]TDQ11645.1 methane monooxygenase PmoA-like [Pedobacter metabolipauper]